MAYQGAAGELIHKYAEQERNAQSSELETVGDAVVGLAVWWWNSATGQKEKDHAGTIHKRINRLRPLFAHEKVMLELHASPQTDDFAERARRSQVSAIDKVLAQLTYMEQLKNKDELQAIWRSWILGMDK